MVIPPLFTYFPLVQACSAIDGVVADMFSRSGRGSGGGRDNFDMIGDGRADSCRASHVRTCWRVGHGGDFEPRSVRLAASRRRYLLRVSTCTFVYDAQYFSSRPLVWFVEGIVGCTATEESSGGFVRAVQLQADSMAPFAPCTGPHEFMFNLRLGFVFHLAHAWRKHAGRGMRIE